MLGERVMDYQNKQAVNVRQELFLKCFEKVNWIIHTYNAVIIINHINW